MVMMGMVAWGLISIVILYLMYDNQKVMMEQLKKQIDQNQEIINWMKKND
jgi:uncharacterized membrane protein YjfL (UPF0719 family)